MDLNSIIMDSKLINMAVSALQSNLGSISESNFTIILGIFVTIMVCARDNSIFSIDWRKKYDDDYSRSSG